MLPYGRQNIDEEDIQAVIAALRSDFLTTGPKVAEFEHKLCEVTSAKYAIACSNGTTALHLAGLALGVGPGDAVIVPTATFLATANSVRYCGADVVFADVDPITGLMGVEHLEEALGRAGDKNVKAVYPVHLSGRCVDLQSLKRVADQHNIKIVADGAHAVGGQVNDAPVGAGLFEDMTTFSFHPVKTIAMGEGGAITTNNEEFAQKMAIYRHHGMVPKSEQGPWCYEMQDLGYNYRVTDIQCALGLSQLKKLEKFVQRRDQIVGMYNEYLSSLSDIVVTPHKESHCNPAWHIYACLVDFDQLTLNRASFMMALREKGIGTQVHYIPVHIQPYYQSLYGEIELSGAMSYYAKEISFPLYPHMSDEDVKYVADTVISLIQEAKK